MTEKFIYPINVMRITQYPDWEDNWFDNIVGEPINTEEAAKYFKEISKTIDDDIIYNLNADGLMSDFRAKDITTERSIRDKVMSVFPAVEVIGNKLYGIMKVDLNAPLTGIETEALKNDLAMQMSDGYNDGMKGDPVSTLAGDLYIDYQAGKNYFMDTEREFDIRLKSADANSFDQSNTQVGTQYTDRLTQTPESNQNQKDYISDKLYFPINASLYFYNLSEGYGSEIFDCTDAMSHEDSAKYMPDIIPAIEWDTKRAFSEHGLMDFFFANNRDLEQMIYDKVVSVVPSIEAINGQLFGVMDLRLREQLSPDEWPVFKSSIEELITAGYGNYDGYEQHVIKTHDGELSFSFWPREDNYFMDTQQEFTQRMTSEPGQKLYEGSMPPIGL